MVNRVVISAMDEHKESCPFCCPRVQELQIRGENSLCLFIQSDDPILHESGIIIPKRHLRTPFELSPDEWRATQELLVESKRRIDEEKSPSGYNLGWNCGRVAGQEVFHAHLHVIPRFSDEPLAGKGIRYWLKQDDNKRTGNI